MSIQLVPTDFSKYVVIDYIHSMGSGRQVLTRFPNDYGASIVMAPGSYGYDQGLAELAVVKWQNETDYSLCYDTPVTDDVLGYLTAEEIEGYLADILALSPQILVE